MRLPTFREDFENENWNKLNDSRLARAYAFLAITVPIYRDNTTGEEYAHIAQKIADEEDYPTLETIQALLMLVVYYRRSLEEFKALRTLSCAISNAQSLSCHIQDCPSVGESESDWCIRKETGIRIIWSAFMFDTQLCNTILPPPILREYDIFVRLPCSERAFYHGLLDKSRLLPHTESGEQRTTPQPGGIRREKNEDQQEILYWCILLFSLLRRIMGWVSARYARRQSLAFPLLTTYRNEEYMPWEEDSDFNKLRTEFDALAGRLPDWLRPAQTQTHIRDKTWASYALLHSLLAICEISLHRKYLPLAPFGEKRPTSLNGTLDHSKFWDSYAQRYFKAARNMIEIMSSYHAIKRLVKTPLTSFAMSISSLAGMSVANT